MNDLIEYLKKVEADSFNEYFDEVIPRVLEELDAQKSIFYVGYWENGDGEISKIYKFGIDDAKIKSFVKNYMEVISSKPILTHHVFNNVSVAMADSDVLSSKEWFESEAYQYHIRSLGSDRAMMIAYKLAEKKNKYIAIVITRDNKFPFSKNNKKALEEITPYLAKKYEEF